MLKTALSGVGKALVNPRHPGLCIWLCSLCCEVAAMWKSKAFYNARQPLPGYRDVTGV